MSKDYLIPSKEFFNLLYNDQKFLAQLGRSMLAAARLETELKRYLTAYAVPVHKYATLGRLIALLRKYALLPKILPHLGMFCMQRNYLAHSLYDLFYGEIEETLLPRSNLIYLDVDIYTERIGELEGNLAAFTLIVRKARKLHMKSAIHK